jgi:hypothetical protein
MSKLKSQELIAHELVCEERFKNISEKLDNLIGKFEEHNKDISDLRKIANIGLGAWRAILGIGIILSAVYTIIRIMRGG